MRLIVPTFAKRKYCTYKMLSSRTLGIRKCPSKRRIRRPKSFFPPDFQTCVLQWRRKTRKRRRRILQTRRRKEEKEERKENEEKSGGTNCTIFHQSTANLFLHPNVKKKFEQTNTHFFFPYAISPSLPSFSTRKQ